MATRRQRVAFRAKAAPTPGPAGPGLWDSPVVAVGQPFSDATDDIQQTTSLVFEGELSSLSSTIGTVVPLDVPQAPTALVFDPQRGLIPRGMGAGHAPMETARDRYEDNIRFARRLNRDRQLRKVAAGIKRAATRSFIRKLDDPRLLKTTPAVRSTRKQRVEAHIQRSRASGRQLGKMPSLSRRTLTCVGRIVRRQVLHALGIAGFSRRLSRGRGGSYHRGPLSSFSCR